MAKRMILRLLAIAVLVGLPVLIVKCGFTVDAHSDLMYGFGAMFIGAVVFFQAYSAKLNELKRTVGLDPVDLEKLRWFVDTRSYAIKRILLFLLACVPIVLLPKLVDLPEASLQVVRVLAMVLLLLTLILVYLGFIWYQEIEDVKTAAFDKAAEQQKRNEELKTLRDNRLKAETAARPKPSWAEQKTP